ncbi:unnamed protein product [Caenorhabditis sp. 36 PRJEB53466]|nr:unnamed protein product [Caenorhabditis sp. 36 PRJEB53466]
MDAWVRPVIYCHKNAFLMIMDLRNRSIPVQWAILMLRCVAGCFGVVIYGIAIHFIYRFFALERNGRIRYFDRQYLPVWFMIPILGGFCWITIDFYLLPMTPVFTEYMKEAIEIDLGMDIKQVVYSGALFYPTDASGRVYFNWRSGLGLVLFMTTMAIPFNVIIFIGAKSWTKIKTFPTSKYGQVLQMQLCKALAAQTLIPVTALFIPFSFAFLCPIFGVDCKILALGLNFVYALYPVVDPLPILFYVQSYRRVISGLFKCCGSAKVHVQEEDLTSRGANSLS